jgi:hypothetical protein
MKREADLAFDSLKKKIANEAQGQPGGNPSHIQPTKVISSVSTMTASVRISFTFLFDY